MLHWSEKPKQSELVKVGGLLGLVNRTVRVDSYKGYRPGELFVIVDYRGQERLVRKIDSPDGIPWGEYGSFA